MRRPGIAGRDVSVGAGGAARVTVPASNSPTRSTDWCRLASPPITTASRAPARSACWSTSVDSSCDREHRAELGVRAREPVHVLEPHGAHEAGAEHRDRPDARAAGADASSSMVSNWAAPASSIASRVRMRVVGLDDCDVEARRLDVRRRRWRRTPRRLPGAARWPGVVATASCRTECPEAAARGRACWYRLLASITRSASSGVTSKVSSPDVVGRRRSSSASRAACSDGRRADREHLHVAQEVLGAVAPLPCATSRCRRGHPERSGSRHHARRRRSP